MDINSHELVKGLTRAGFMRIAGGDLTCAKMLWPTSTSSILIIPLDPADPNYADMMRTAMAQLTLHVLTGQNIWREVFMLGAAGADWDQAKKLVTQQ